MAEKAWALVKATAATNIAAEVSVDGVVHLLVTVLTRHHLVLNMTQMLNQFFLGFTNGSKNVFAQTLRRNHRTLFLQADNDSVHLFEDFGIRQFAGVLPPAQVIFRHWFRLNQQLKWIFSHNGNHCIGSGERLKLQNYLINVGLYFRIEVTRTLFRGLYCFESAHVTPPPDFLHYNNGMEEYQVKVSPEMRAPSIFELAFDCLGLLSQGEAAMSTETRIEMRQSGPRPLRLAQSWPESWSSFFEAEEVAGHLNQIETDLRALISPTAIVYPNPQHIFRAFELTPPEKVKVVLIGQDPYHGPGQAHGLAFSVLGDQALPPSLRNIFLELKNDLGIEPSLRGDLTHWAKQGVLLLNSVLTVEDGRPGSHAGRGWETFTDAIVARLALLKQDLVFVLWGKYAEQKANRLDLEKHLVLRSAHPSPLSAYRGFFGSHPFSKINQHLDSHGLGRIDWRLPQ